jgi:hypothetical protein
MCARPIPCFARDTHTPREKLAITIKTKRKENPMEAYKPKVSEVVEYRDELGNPHNALITCVWSDTCVNLVYLNPDEKAKDGYGRQTKFVTSVGRASESMVYGRYFRIPSDPVIPYKAPAQV